MNNTLLELLIVWPILMLLHELGHIISGKLLGYRFEYLGFREGSIFPHVAMTDYEATQWKRSIFLLGGFSTTLSLFLLIQVLGLSVSKMVFLAFLLQMAIETNPFFSDISMLMFYRESYDVAHEDIGELKNKIKAQWFTPKWYLHFALWLFALWGVYKLIF